MLIENPSPDNYLHGSLWPRPAGSGSSALYEGVWPDACYPEPSKSRSSFAAILNSGKAGESMKISDSRLETYIKRGFPNVSGWLKPTVIWALAHLNALQEGFGVKGGVCEVGVHHGKFFLALEDAVHETALFHAVDVFDGQHLNIDMSGRDRFRSFARM